MQYCLTQRQTLATSVTACILVFNTMMIYYTYMYTHTHTQKDLDNNGDGLLFCRDTQCKPASIFLTQ